ncbi:hypothetical protein CLAVI_000573 [Candidatus Clavichlamydia salmonicola]|uniref:thioredoxin domain-containing protein n=1 Tax=Candidatus Clavichlamydia salmonicola TaxID=469812 RepID=UPI0018910A15|nr:thioredoxin domain-containing protein [Candidatus Clavichlamydia salmonicola]MBF5050951.1 hypothetical protein [Candidatus Clavichlamydia salmonicola]
MEQEPFYNRLKQEQSPYLLSHASTPVNWFPWGEEAFELSREEDKPIFLSIGDISSYWCRVMIAETFNNNKLANEINDVFICVKVDSAELPHVADLYSEFAQMMMSSWEGVWPLNLVLTSDLMPFFAAHYISSGDHTGIPGMVDLIEKIKLIWGSPENKEKVIEQAHRVVNVVSLLENYVDKSKLVAGQVSYAAELLYKLMDPVFGGLKSVPKLLNPVLLFFLLRHAYSGSNVRSLFCVQKTLDMMFQGSIHDHIGGGLYSYAIDEQWLVPGFEKNLIDNIWITLVCLEMWEYTRADRYATMVEDIVEFLITQMKDSSGGFYSSKYFDIFGEEADFYGWSYEEVEELLHEDSALFCEYYNISKQEVDEDKKGIVYINSTLNEAALADHYGKSVDELHRSLKSMRKILLEARNQRNPAPSYDDQLLTFCNGAMIHLLTRVGRACYRPEYVKIAIETAIFCEDNLRSDQHLLHRWRKGSARFDASLEDYATLIMGYITLFEADCGVKWLRKALELTAEVEEQFLGENGAFYAHNEADSNILIRLYDFSDEEKPSGNALHADNLIRLYHITANQKFKERAQHILEVSKRHADFYPILSCYYFSIVQKFLDPRQLLLVIVLNDSEDDKDTIAHLFKETYMPYTTVIWYRPNKDIEMKELLPYLSFLNIKNNQTTIYGFFNDYCVPAMSGIKKLEDFLQKI